MTDFLFQRTLTPEEIQSYKAQVEAMQNQQVLQDRQFNTIANMTKNISPLGNLGILLGTIGANMYNNYQQGLNDKAIIDYLNSKNPNNPVRRAAINALQGSTSAPTTTFSPNTNYSFDYMKNNPLPEKWTKDWGQRYYGGNTQSQYPFSVNTVPYYRQAPSNYALKSW